LSGLFVLLILVLNFGISWWNAKVAGQAYVPISQSGSSWMKVLLWSAIVQSAAGFTYVYLTVLVFGAAAFGYLTQDYAQGAYALGLLILFPTIIVSGVAIWLHSVQQAIREPSFRSIAGAGWNTFAQAHNMITYIQVLPELLKSAGVLFKSPPKSKDGATAYMAMLALFLVAVAFVGGLMTTAYLVTREIDKSKEEVFAVR
jgi:hypothetical protein